MMIAFFFSFTSLGVLQLLVHSFDRKQIYVIVLTVASLLNKKVENLGGKAGRLTYPFPVYWKAIIVLKLLTYERSVMRILSALIVQ